MIMIVIDDCTMCIELSILIVQSDAPNCGVTFRKNLNGKNTKIAAWSFRQPPKNSFFKEEKVVSTRSTATIIIMTLNAYAKCFYVTMASLTMLNVVG
jgi:hypothetical protein